MKQVNLSNIQKLLLITIVVLTANSNILYNQIVNDLQTIVFCLGLSHEETAKGKERAAPGTALAQGGVGQSCRAAKG
jgi:hypothetical protein